LEAGSHVSHIASFDLVTCAANAGAGEVLGHPDVASFDAIPVRDEGRIVAVLERGRGSDEGAFAH
jgi:hypothetical protein